MNAHPTGPIFSKSKLDCKFSLTKRQRNGRIPNLPTAAHTNRSNFQTRRRTRSAYFKTRRRRKKRRRRTMSSPPGWRGGRGKRVICPTNEWKTCTHTRRIPCYREGEKQVVNIQFQGRRNRVNYRDGGTVYFRLPSSRFRRRTACVR